MELCLSVTLYSNVIHATTLYHTSGLLATPTHQLAPKLATCTSRGGERGKELSEERSDALLVMQVNVTRVCWFARFLSE